MIAITDLPPCNSYDIGIYRTMAEVFGPDVPWGEPTKTSTGVDVAIDGFKVHFKVVGLDIQVPFYRPLDDVVVGFTEEKKATNTNTHPYIDPLAISPDILALYTYMSPEMREWYMLTFLESKYKDQETGEVELPWLEEPADLGDTEDDESLTELTPSAPKFANDTLNSFWNDLTPEVQEIFDPVLTSQVSVLDVGVYNTLYIELTLAGLATPVPTKFYADGTVDMQESDWLVFPEIINLKRSASPSAQTDDDGAFQEE